MLQAFLVLCCFMRESLRFHLQDSLNPTWDCVKELKDLSAGDILEFEVWDDDRGEMMTKLKAVAQGDDLLGRTSLSVKDSML